DALIGYTGYVGGTLRQQHRFDALYRSTTIDEISGRTFDTVVCAGAPGQKWLANQEPEADHAAIQKLIDQIDSLQCNKFVLVSTVDVFQHPAGVDESSDVDEQDLQAYGLHRRYLEQ